MDRYIESCLALYDLKVVWHYTNPENPNWNYQYYFLEQSLEGGLSIKCRSDGYYVFDFSKASIGRPVKYDKRVIADNLYIRNERIEVIHAFLACLRYVTQKGKKFIHTSDMDFIDNFRGYTI